MIIYTATPEEWEEIKYKEEFISQDFDTEGFIHCSNPDQTIWVLNKHFKHQEKMILLCIDPAVLKSKYIQEDLKGTGEKFPHVYGSINVDSIIKIIEIAIGENGIYFRNKQLTDLLNQNHI